MLAMRNQASLLARVFSKSLASRRHRPSQAKVRSTTQRFFSSLGPSDDLDAPPTKRGDCLAQLVATIDAVREDISQGREDPTQCGEQRYRAVTVLDIGCVHQQHEQKTLSVSDDVALAPHHFLGGVKAPRAAGFRRLNGLTVDHSGGRNDMTPEPPAHAPYQREIDQPPEALIAPQVEVILDGGARRKVLRQRSPRLRYFRAQNRGILGLTTAASRHALGSSGIRSMPARRSSWVGMAVMGRPADRIGHRRAALSQTLLAAHGAVARGLMLDLGIELGTEQDHDG
jgi:hypothetical protein